VRETALRFGGGQQGGPIMASIQPHTHSFIVKVWSAAPDGDSGTTEWRGRVTHVPSGEDRHFLRLAELTAFIAPYLHELGVQPTLRFRLRRWVRR
jgi:hypothetical protein